MWCVCVCVCLCGCVCGGVGGWVGGWMDWWMGLGVGGNTRRSVRLIQGIISPILANRYLNPIVVVTISDAKVAFLSEFSFRLCDSFA